jgi:hypothetical protein
MSPTTPDAPGRRTELALVEDTAERTWVAVARAKAEQALRDSVQDARLLRGDA